MNHNVRYVFRVIVDYNFQKKSDWITGSDDRKRIFTYSSRYFRIASRALKELLKVISEYFH